MHVVLNTEYGCLSLDFSDQVGLRQSGTPIHVPYRSIVYDIVLGHVQLVEAGRLRS